MRLTKRKGFILPLALMVFAGVSFVFLVWLSVNQKAEEAKTDNHLSQCVKSGCSGEVCVEEGDDVTTTCIYLKWYPCLSLTRCERQVSGQCGWTENKTYLNCLKEKNK